MRLPPDSFEGARTRAVAWLTAWDSQGAHRTGTTGDEAGALWLAHQAAGVGVEATTEVFELDRLDPVACYLELEGERISGVPAFDAPATGANGVIGALSLSRRDEAVLIAELPPQSVYTGQYERLRRDTSHRAVVIICAGARPGMAMLNAEGFRHPYGAPTIHLSSEARETVLAGAARAAPARVVADSRYVPATARNVVVAIRGSRRPSPPVVVMTPRSSWWQSTAERGGGLVCWLESLRALVAAPPACNVIFTANSGHELGHLGLDDFMARRPGWERPISEGGATWVHLGANIGAADGQLSLQSASDDLRRLTQAELARAGQAPDIVAPKTLVPSGETRDIHRAGGRYVTLVGSNPLFHLPQDRWPHAVDPHVVTRVATAAAALVVKLTR
ncbi:MAG: hypothetical protein WA709_05155 [Stellaceae bacterium]